MRPEMPRVAVVIPVYNGQEFLAECLESVLRQTYQCWTAVVVDNKSSDGTGRMADEYARREPRIRVLHCEEFLGQADNYNRALSQVDDGAAYVKVVEADNWITDDALSKAVALAESDPEIGFVGSYCLMGRELLGAGVDYRTSVIPGREVLRLLFLEERYLLGMPTGLLFRAAALRSTRPWFRAGVFYDDADLCVRLLQKWKMGYVHQVLAYIRADNAGLYSSYKDFDQTEAYMYFLAEDYAARFFDPGPCRSILRACESAYYRRLARAVLGGRPQAYWAFHRRALEARRQTLRKGLLLRSLVLEALDSALNPKATIERLARKLPSRQQG